MKLGTTVGLRGDPDGFALHVKELEDAGIEYLWTGEAYSADAVSTMGFLAAVSRRAQIGSSILPLYSRTPTLLAMTAIGLDKLSKGRFILGLGKALKIIDRPVRDRARPGLALYFGGMGARGRNFYNDVLRGYGFEEAADGIQDAYLGGGRRTAAALVPQELVDGTSLVGDAGFVRDRIAAFREAGVTVLNVQPVGPNGLADVETVASWL